MRIPAVFFQAIIYGNPDYYPPMIRGAQVLHERGITQEILSDAFYSDSLPNISAYYPPSTQVIRIPRNSNQNWRRYPNFIYRVLRIGSRRSRFFVGYDMHGFLGAKLLSARYNRPLVYHSHDYVENNQSLSLSNRILKMFEKKFAPTADLIIVPDADRAAFMQQDLRLSMRPLVVANAALEAPARSSMALPEKLAERGKHYEKIVLRQGHIGENHGIEETIQSLSYWSNRQWGFVIVGPGEEKYKQYLRDLAYQCDVSNQFEILPPVNSYSELAKYTVGAHLGHGLYTPSHVNHRFIASASNKTMEYMAAGLPILLSDTPGSRTIVEKYQNGVLVEVDNPASIAHGINTVLGNPDMADTWGKGSTRAFLEEYNYSRQYTPAIERFFELAQR